MFLRDQRRKTMEASLQQLGAAMHLIKRQPKDGNGQPDGDAETIGSLYGIDYRKSLGGSITIDLPGVILKNEGHFFVATMTDLCIPDIGDTVTINGTDIPILQVNPVMDTVYVLALKE